MITVTSPWELFNNIHFAFGKELLSNYSVDEVAAGSINMIGLIQVYQTLCSKPQETGNYGRVNN